MKNDEKGDRLVESFWLPKLPSEELKLLKARNENYLETFLVYNDDGEDPDVDEEEMNKSKSKDRYIYCECWRNTTKLTIDLNQCSLEDENSDHLSEMFTEPKEPTTLKNSRKRKRGPDFGSDETESEKDSEKESNIDITDSYRE